MSFSAPTATHASQVRRPTHKCAFTKPLLLLSVLSMLSVANLFGVQQAWISKYSNGPGTTNYGLFMGLDSAGSIYVAGHSTRTNAPYDYDYLIMKLSPSGALQWANRFGSPGVNDQIRSAVVSSNGDVFVTGTTNTIKYRESGLVAWMAPYGGRDIAVDDNGYCYVTGFQTNDFSTVKLDPLGSNVWVRTWDYIGKGDTSHAIAITKQGEVFVGGMAEWFCERFSCAPEPHVIKYDPFGNLLWDFVLRRAVHSDNSQFRGFQCDAEGNIYSAFNHDGHACCAWAISKIRGDGQFLWVKGLTSSPVEGVRALALDTNANVYSTGGLVDSSLQTAKLTKDGTNLWTSHYFGPTQFLHRGHGVVSDAGGNAYVTGRSTSETANDYVTLKYSPTGQQLWVKRFTEAGNSDDQAHAIAVSPSGDVYVTGFSNPSPGTYEITTIKYIQTPPIEKKTNGTVLLSFCGTPTSNYVIQASSTLTNWTNIGTNAADATGLYTFEDTNAPAYPQRFYRSVQQ